MRNNLGMMDRPFYERKVAGRGIAGGCGAGLRIMVGCDENTFEREEGNAHSPPDIHYGKEPNKGKRLMRRPWPSEEPAGKTEADAAENNSAGDGHYGRTRYNLVFVAIQPITNKNG